LGAAAPLAAADVRWLKPLPLWTGILAGPLAWAFDLEASYALVKWVCRTQNYAVLQLITAVSLVIVIAGAAVSWTALSHTPPEAGTDGGQPIQRARFLAIVGLIVSALFGLQIVAGAIPHWMLDACL
jgi:hypothetical protein